MNGLFRSLVLGVDRKIFVQFIAFELSIRSDPRAIKNYYIHVIQLNQVKRIHVFTYFFVLLTRRLLLTLMDVA